MASRTITYRVEVTAFHPAVSSKIDTYSEASDVATFIRGLPAAEQVLFVAALDLDEGVDYGNFYLFTNAAGAAHVMLHEHREFLPRDPATADDGAEVTFLDEGAAPFSVSRAMTTSHQRAVEALEFWLPRQLQWPEFQWE